MKYIILVLAFVTIVFVYHKIQKRFAELETDYAKRLNVKESLTKLIDENKSKKK